jgi:hypothetical protein
VDRALAAGNAVHGLTAQVGHGKDTRPEPDPLAWPSPSSQPHPAPHLPCEDLLYIQLQGRAPRAGPGCLLILEGPTTVPLITCGATPPVAGWRDRETVARQGAGCLPLAPSGHVGADAHSVPGSPPHGQLAATSAVARGAARAAIPPAPDPEALQDRGQGRAYGASLAGASADPGPRVLTRIHPAPIGGMARFERGRGSVAGSCSNHPASPRPDLDAVIMKQHVTHHAGHTAWRWHARGQGFESP